MKYSVAIVALAATAVSAQLSAIPQCALTCAISSLGSTGCGQTDIKCICTATSFIAALTPCVQAACSAADLAKTITAAEGLCLQAGVTLSIPTAGATSTTAAASSSEAATSTVESVSTTLMTTYSATVVTSTETSSAVVVVPTTYSNATATATGGSYNATSAVPTTALPTASPSGNAASNNRVTVGGLAAVLAFAAALL